MKEDEDTYMAVVESIHLMVLIHELWWNTSFWDKRRNDVIMIINVTLRSGSALSRCNDTAALGLAHLGAPCHGVWVDYSFLPDTRFAW